jgi:hypothetical protein
VTSISSWFIPHVYGWIVLFVKCPWDEIPKSCDPSSSFQYPGTRSPSPCLAPPGAVLLGHGLRFPATDQKEWACDPGNKHGIQQQKREREIEGRIKKHMLQDRHFLPGGL